ncbi:hypothetical protein [Streptomyces hebeiensis]
MPELFVVGHEHRPEASRAAATAGARGPRRPTTNSSRTSGNRCGTTMVIGEKCADMIKEDAST